MAKRDETKTRIAEAFIELVEAMPIERVSISTLVEAMGVNRKTFYYHFSDKNDLIIWIYRSRLAQLLAEQFSPDQIMTPLPQQADSYPRLPYYVRIKLGIRSLDQSEFFRLLAGLFAERRTYYLKVFGADDAMFRTYLEKLYEPAYRSDIDFILGGRSFSPDSTAFLARYYVAASINLLQDILEDPGKMQPAEQFLNLAHEGMRHAIEDHPMRRFFGTR